MDEGGKLCAGEWALSKGPRAQGARLCLEPVGGAPPGPWAHSWDLKMVNSMFTWDASSKHWVHHIIFELCQVQYANSMFTWGTWSKQFFSNIILRKGQVSNCLLGPSQIIFDEQEYRTWDALNTKFQKKCLLETCQVASVSSVLTWRLTSKHWTQDRTWGTLSSIRWRGPGP